MQHSYVDASARPQISDARYDAPCACTETGLYVHGRQIGGIRPVGGGVFAPWLMDLEVLGRALTHVHGAQFTLGWRVAFLQLAVDALATRDLVMARRCAAAVNLPPLGSPAEGVASLHRDLVHYRTNWRDNPRVDVDAWLRVMAARTASRAIDRRRQGFEPIGDVDAKGVFNPALHPRQPAGIPIGGQFAPKLPTGLSAYLIEVGASPAERDLISRIYRVLRDVPFDLDAIRETLKTLDYDSLSEEALAIVKSAFDPPKPIEFLRTSKFPRGFDRNEDLLAYVGPAPPVTNGTISSSRTPNLAPT